MDDSRYSRQIRFAGVGVEGQERLARSRIVVCGVGALGSAIANTLVRAGVGFTRLVDRDFLEPHNLQRQTLYDESDLAADLPKAEAAALKLRNINSNVTIEPIVADLDARSITRHAGDVDLMLDGTDNFETRFLINDFALRENMPWIYAGAIGSVAQTMTIVPGQTPCLRCVVPEPPPPGSIETCDTAGILGPTIAAIAAIQCAEALKILCGHPETIQPNLIVLDVWETSFRTLSLSKLRETGACPACGQRCYDWLEGGRGSHTMTLCGRNAVQVVPAGGLDIVGTAGGNQPMAWDALQKRLHQVGKVTANRFLARVAVDGYELTVFPDGRAIIKGTSDIAEARTIYAKYIGS